MKIGYVIQGSTDRAFLSGLRDRWCQYADLQLLDFRGTRLRPRMYPNICREGRLKECDVIVILTDTDNNDLNSVYRQEKSHLTPDVEYFVVLGVAVRNIECWICADSDYIAQHYPCDPNDLRVDDPKDAFETAIGITRNNKREEEIASLIRNYPSFKPMLGIPSFKRFYDEARDYAQRNGCQIPNEWER